MAAGTAIVAAVTTLLSTVAANQAADALSRESDRKIADANATAASASARVAEAHTAAAGANERAAKANERAAELETALDAERAKRLPRRLTKEQIEALDRDLADEKRRFFVVVKDDVETRPFAEQFVEVLSRHHLIEGVAFKSFYTDGPGVKLYIPLDGGMSPDDAARDPIIQAFNAIGVLGGWSWGATPPNPGFAGPEHPSFPQWAPGHPVLWIGEKPLPKE
jgi:hypothetical protein